MIYAKPKKGDRNAVYIYIKVMILIIASRLAKQGTLLWEPNCISINIRQQFYFWTQSPEVQSES